MKIPKITLILSILCVGISCASAQSTYQITVFGTDIVTKDQIKSKYSSNLDSLMSLYISDRENYYEQKSALETQLFDKNKFSYVNVKLFRSYRGNVSFIIDYVENAHAKTRLDFRKLEKKDFEDPNGLIKKWDEYASASRKLFDKGEITDMKCPVIHCTWSFNHAKLKLFLTFFTKNVPQNINMLSDMLNHSDSDKHRANSALLLAHANISAEKLVELLNPSVEDPSSTVRNNSMRVIYYAIRHHNARKISLDTIIKALDYPSFTDRNKALVILRYLPLQNLTKPQLRRLLPILIEILEKKDAHNYRNAFTVIKKISKKEHDVDDLINWKSWVQSILK